MSGRLQGRVIIVTGATKGIGRETAIQLAAEGAAVCATGRDAADGASLVEAITACGGRAIFAPHDVASETDWRRVFNLTHAELGPVSGLVNNAGAFLVRPLAETSAADFGWIFGVNVAGPQIGLRLAFEAMAANGLGGSIVNVSSLMGQVGFPGAVAYCATKGAVTGLTKTWALAGSALDPKIRVNSLHPGVIWTPMITGQFGDDQALQDAFAADTPLKIIGLPAYMADAIVFLLSEESAQVTGAELTVDGGRGAD